MIHVKTVLLAVALLAATFVVAPHTASAMSACTPIFAFIDGAPRVCVTQTGLAICLSGHAGDETLGKCTPLTP